MSSSGTYTIRPAGRHILTIGRDLIQDHYAAVVELVKNAYDADSPDVEIEFEAKPENGACSIIITDHGHGMSRDTVIHKWMVPSTRDKLDRQTSPSGRVMQGRKGVGRYAASILGSDLLLQTVTEEGEETTVYVEWKTFDDAEYLDDVEILIETKYGNNPSGTKLIMNGNSEYMEEWNQRQFDKLRFELKKLMSPVAVAVNKENQNDDEFRITMIVDGFPDVEDITEVVEPYPLFDLFDYRIAGKVNADGKGILTYTLQKARNAVDEKIEFSLDDPTDCGELIFDIRVYDRDKESIDSLIERGLKDELGNYVGKNQAKRLLNEFNGIGVYRNGFRIRPLGDAEFDWLLLNRRRVQNPSMRIGSNQVIGFVQIQSDELSGLEEKSARDGLRDNMAYTRLKEITGEVIAKLEERRFRYRRSVGLSKAILKISREVERLFSFDELILEIRSKLLKAGISRETIDEIVQILNRDAEFRSKMAEDIEKNIAIYQGQATLGKIVNVILHEGRRPLNYFRNQIRNLRYWYDKYQKTGDGENLAKLIPAIEGIGKNAEFFVQLFGRLDPLAAGKRPPKKPLLLTEIIRGAISVFEKEMEQHHIEVKIIGSDNFELLSWEQDIYAIFTNLIDNSIYWMVEKNTSKREIIIDVVTKDDSLLYIDYRDTGPGIEPSLIDSEVIFEPQFSTKPSGTGLGLAIAGEAAVRNDLELRVLKSEQGAQFRLMPQVEEE